MRGVASRQKTSEQAALHTGRGSVRLERTVRDREVGGSNPPAPTCILFYFTEKPPGNFKKINNSEADSLQVNPPAPTCILFIEISKNHFALGYSAIIYDF